MVSDGKGCHSLVWTASGITLATATLPSVATSPITTLFNQALAVLTWGLLILLAHSAASAFRRRWGFAEWGASVSLCGLLIFPPATAPILGGGLLASAYAGSAAAVFCWARSVERETSSHDTFRGLGAVMVLAFLLSGILHGLVAVLQVHAPQGWQNAMGLAPAVFGRASGQLRQPNHLSTLLVWALVAWVYLRWRWQLRLQRLLGDFDVIFSWAIAILLIHALVLSASRTGLIGVLVLAAWGVADRALASRTRRQLISLPLLYAMSWTLMQWLTASAVRPGIHLPAQGGDISSSRFGIWANTWELIKMHPWAGVGWGEFNFAWTLTPFPNRPVAFFDHTHNLPLQLAVELGVPAALLICGLLLWGLWRGFERSGQALAAGDLGPRCAFMMVVLVGVHSLLEYPLWYAYFLLPTAFAWGYALQRPDASQEIVNVKAARAAWGWGVVWRVLPGALMVAGSLYAMWDYQRVVAIYTSKPDEPPLEMRIEQGKRSVFFAHQAYYAEATVGALHERPADALPAIAVASHHLIDTRLMMAWINALVDAGEVDKARYLTARLREFRNPNSVQFLSACEDTDAAPAYCGTPSRVYSFEDFR